MQRSCQCGATETKDVEGVWQTHELSKYLVDMPEKVCAGLNLWSVLPHSQIYYHSGTQWAPNPSADVWAVTIPVEPGDKIFATSFGTAGENGYSSNGIRCTFFDAKGVAKTTGPAETYAEFTANGGYLLAPEGAVAVNVAMYGDKDSYELYLLNREHSYLTEVTKPTCTEAGYTTYTCDLCGHSFVDNHVDAKGHTEVILPAIKANSARPGITEGCYCSTCDAVLEEQKEIPAKGYDWMLEDGEFKLLLIGNSFSEDASSCGQGMTESQLYNILRAMLGEDVKVTLGLLYSGGKGVHWFATQTEQGNKTPSFCVITPENQTWGRRAASTTEAALAWTDWDVVTLQPYDMNFNTEQESVPYPEQTDEKFYPLEVATEYMLDFIDVHAPQADVYCYMHWARSYSSVLNVSLSTYHKFAAFYPKTLDYIGNESGNRYAGIIPVGLSVQNARTTYLSLLSYHAEKGVSVNLQNDPQIGLQRDGGHLTFNIGRYIAGLTFAEILVPEEIRTAEYTIPDIRKTESVGLLPKEYTEIAQKAVFAAVVGEFGSFSAFKTAPIDSAERLVVTKEELLDNNSFGQDNALY